MAEYTEALPKQGKNRRERIFATKVKHFKSNAQIQRDLSQWNYKSKEKLFKLQDITSDKEQKEYTRLSEPQKYIRSDLSQEKVVSCFLTLLAYEKIWEYPVRIL